MVDKDASQTVRGADQDNDPRELIPLWAALTVSECDLLDLRLSPSVCVRLVSASE